VTAPTVTDLFCGAGGSSLGAEYAGAQLVMAANHWQTAIDVHQVAFPDAGHDVADISQADPRRYPVTDILIASPECTNHSQARGISRKRQDPELWDAPDPSAERSRATMWDVPRFAEQIRYSAVVVENVIEATKWALWPAWWQAMELLGYSGRVLSMNSMHHGVPQSRDRIYVVWLRDGLQKRVNLEMELGAWCDRCTRQTAVRQGWKNERTVGRYGTQWVWLCTTCGTRCEPTTEPAASIIDWDLDCPRIGDRKRPLADKTRARIAAGLERYGWMDPIVTAGAGNTYETTPGNRAKPVTEPLATQQTTSTSALVTPPPFLFNTAHGGRTADLDAPHPTVCASDDRQSLVIPMRRNGQAASTAEVLPTVTAGGNHHGLLMRNNTGGAEMITPIDQPARTMTTSGHQSLLMPYYGQSIPHGTDRPIGTVTTKDRHALIDTARAVDDCGFRMLEPYEVAAAMAFPEHYIPRTLPKKDQVKLAGNAVTPPVQAWIIGRVLQGLSG
jgi:DNA (cytosine-5)-methyltransferase 1